MAKKKSNKNLVFIAGDVSATNILVEVFGNFDNEFKARQFLYNVRN
ncbi:MAG: hypothetical protein Q8N99_08150 [Nanoarchaeota archaeon]|nr:hypothetical protein [Nanoarchaeota archaeon]